MYFSKVQGLWSICSFWCNGKNGVYECTRKKSRVYYVTNLLYEYSSIWIVEGELPLPLLARINYIRYGLCFLFSLTYFRVFLFLVNIAVYPSCSSTQPINNIDNGSDKNNQRETNTFNVNIILISRFFFWYQLVMAYGWPIIRCQGRGGGCWDEKYLLNENSFISFRFVVLLCYSCNIVVRPLQCLVASP